VRPPGLERADDRAIWDYAKANGFVLATLDADFVEIASLRGAPPKIIWLRCGNQSTAVIEALLRNHAALIIDFERDKSACLEIY
jgi:predicted nuclease of predicted toxin-antitoxin system